MTLDELEYKIIKIEEKINILSTNTNFSNLYKEHVRLLNQEYGKLISSLRKEFKSYNPSNQVNLRKILLSKLPIKPMDLDAYLLKIQKFLTKNELNFNLIEYEILLNKLRLIENNKVSNKNLNKELLSLL